MTIESYAGILPDREGIWGFAGTDRYGNLGGNQGHVFYVDAEAATASDANDGTDPEAPFLTMQAAVDACVSGRGDLIFINPGEYAEDVSVTKNYVSLIGSMEGGYARPDLVGLAGPSLTVHAQGFVMRHVRVAAITGMDAVVQQGNGFKYLDCVFDGDTANDFNLLPDLDNDSYTASEGLIEKCTFRWGGKGLMFTNPGPGVEGGISPTDVVVRKCQFYQHTTNDIDDTYVGGNDTTFYDCLITGCQFLTVSAAYVYILLTAGANNTGMISDCYFADADVLNTQVVLPAGIMFVGNFDVTGIAAL